MRWNAKPAHRLFLYVRQTHLRRKYKILKLELKLYKKYINNNLLKGFITTSIVPY